MSDLPFTIRRMRPEDKPAILDLSSQIWDGTDYLPAVFDEWVADAVGEFVAVLRDGRVVGCAKLSFLTPTDAWLEGLRKDPRVTEPGVGRAAMGHLLVRLAERTDLTSIRFSTHVRNQASIITNQRLGFRLHATRSIRYWEGSRRHLLSRVSAAVSSGSGPRIDVIRDEEVLRQFLRRPGSLEAADGLIAEGWRAAPFSEQLVLSSYAAGGACLGVRSGAGLAGLAVARIGRRPHRITMDLAFLDADDDGTAAWLIDGAFQELARAVEQEPDSKAPCRVQWMVPSVDRLRRWSDTAGLVAREPENDLLVFEYPLEELRARRGPGGTS